MSRTAPALLLAALLALACTRPTPEPAPPPPVPAQTAPAPDAAEAARGRRLYHRGEGEGGAELKGLIGPERVELTGRAAACVHCHHFNGEGRKEGGVAAPAITGRALFQARTGAREADRPAYDEQTLTRAITRGVSPTGRSLNIAMPRFELSAQELSGLLAYLRVLGAEPVPGVGPARLHVGAALPLTGPLAAVGAAVREVLQAAVADVNARGGLYGRRLELLVEDSGGPDGADASLARLGPRSLALVSSHLPRALSAGGASLPEELPPVVGPLGLPEWDVEPEAPVFFLHPGLDVQARAAVQHLAEDGARRAWAVVAARDGHGERWEAGALREAERRELRPPLRVDFAPGARDARGVAAALRRERASAVLFWGSGAELEALGRALDAHGVRADLYAPALLASELQPAAGGGALTRATFTSPALTGEGLAAQERAFAAFLQRHGLRARHGSFQRGAYASVRLLEEALKRAGADVSREGLVAALESLQGFETGVTPPVTFSTRRRVGVHGASLVRWAPAPGAAPAPVAPWREVAP